MPLSTVIGRHFGLALTKGKPKVVAEVYLIFTGYKLKRKLSALGF